MEKAGKLRFSQDIAALVLPSTMKVSFPKGFNIMNFDVTAVPELGPYGGRGFVFCFQVPPGYPHEPPVVKCKTWVDHPNINSMGDMDCEFLLAGWRPTYDMSMILRTLHQLLTQPSHVLPVDGYVPGTSSPSDKDECVEEHLSTRCLEDEVFYTDPSNLLGETSFVLEESDHVPLIDCGRTTSYWSTIPGFVTFASVQLSLSTDGFATTNLFPSLGSSVYIGDLEKYGKVLVKSFDKKSLAEFKEGLLRIVCSSSRAHRNVLHLIGAAFDNSAKLLIVYDFPSEMSLREKLKLKGLHWSCKVRVAAAVARGMYHITSDYPPIVPKAITTESIFVRDDDCPVISDLDGVADSHEDAVKCYGQIIQELFSDEDNVQAKMFLKLASDCCQSDKDMRPSLGDVLSSLNPLSEISYEHGCNKHQPDDYQEMNVDPTLKEPKGVTSYPSKNT